VSDALARRAGAALARAGLMLITAESCTGGLLAGRVTAVPGSSRWFDRGLVVYSNAAKQELLGVDPALLCAHGAVSEAVVLAMARSASGGREDRFGLAVSGVAGPGGGTASKPVGTVCIAWQRGAGAGHARRLQLGGDRDAVRALAVERALEGVLEMLEGGVAPR